MEVQQRGALFAASQAYKVLAEDTVIMFEDIAADFFGDMRHSNWCFRRPPGMRFYNFNMANSGA